ncbi:sensory neuron membrane protein 1-like protein [Sarcoptes scabiei]|uniref:Sensory neuron membrane protein 1-like protein n=1 Tax=Sarcoptes scabiei TaxID=52283 RepID=A0A132AKY2_SARSC|nr:sensory neuron membrane protein 1-like protein [Sarcoptes scabiei]
MEQEQLDQTIKMAIAAKDDELLNSLTGFIYKDEVEKLLITGSENLGKSILGEQDLNKCVINTGKEEIDRLTEFLSYGDKSRLTYWDDSRGKHCNTLLGTDARQFKPGLTKDDKIWVFEPMLCRSLYAVNEILPNEDVKDIPTLRFVIHHNNFDRNIMNECYCYEKDPRECMGSLLNLKKCDSSSGFEIMASPGFFYTNTKLLNITGLDRIVKPEQATVDDYGTIFDIEPHTGILLRGEKRLMLSVKVRKHAVPKLAKLSSEYQIAPFIYLIEVWLINIHFMFRSNLFLSLFFLCSLIRKSGEIDDENADRLKEKLKPIKILRGVFIGLTVIGCAMILISIIIFASR